ncbi:hypothetical protein AYO44_10300 [Planctomycetaceae bacterium SCGC AG-212-F19]|nr:hypothetical protein AYO44_10300 [Planctomycetaceae bacterium SCGC AG-212-F19]
MRKLVATMVGAAVGITCVSLTSCECALGAEAVLPNGMRFQGSVHLARDGRFAFATADRTFGLQQLERVKLSPALRPSVFQRASHRVTLLDGQFLTGTLRHLDATAVHIQPAWSDKPIAIPRAAVAAVGHPPGVITIIDEDFANGLEGCRLKGDPVVRERDPVAARTSLVLDRPGQAAEYVLPSAIEAGRLALSYRTVVPQPAGAHWFVDAIFSGNDLPIRLSVELAGRGTTIVREAPGLDPATAVAFVTQGWHRLQIELARSELLVQVDDQVLHRGKVPSSARLSKVRLRCGNGPLAAILGGEVWINDFVLTRFVDELPRPPGDLDQDEVWLASGDQQFGKVLGADRHKIEMSTRFGPRTVSWADVRAVHFRRQPSPPRSSSGEHVRIGIDAGAGNADQLEGVLAGMDERRITLNHAVLGSIAVERDHVRYIQWRFQGRRLELEHGIYHLGEKPIAGSDVRPEGLSLRRTFALTAVPAAARLQVAVAHLPAPGDDATVARMLQRGGLRTEVVLNGRVVDYLNRHVARSPAQPQTITLALPAANLRVGDNVLELRQTVDPDTGRSANCIVSALVVEIPGST